MSWGNGAPRGWPGSSGGGLDPADLPAYLPQWIPAGAWTADPANTQNALVTKPYGSGPGSTYSIYTCIDFPQISQDSAQYWYFTTAPPIGWASNQIKFKIHFIVEDTISLPGAYRFTLGARRQTDPSTPSGVKTSGNVDYSLAAATTPRYFYTALSGAITIVSAVAGEALALELTRGTAPSNDESDSAYVVGMELHWI